MNGLDCWSRLDPMGLDLEVGELRPAQPAEKDAAPAAKLQDGLRHGGAAILIGMPALVGGGFWGWGKRASGSGRFD